MATIIVVPDVHVPYHDDKAWNLCLNVIKDVTPDQVICIGDFCDFYAVSQYRKNPERKQMLMWEVNKVNGELDRLADISKDVVFLEGNHENRLQRYMEQNAPALYGITSIEKLFHFEKRGWKHFPYGDYYTRNKVTYVHDLGKAGKYAMHQTMDLAGGNVVFGHTHRGGVVYESHLGSGGNFCLNVGWLGNYKQLDYKHRFRAEREFRMGFGIVEEVGGLNFAQFIPIVKGRCYVGKGKVYSFGDG